MELDRLTIKRIFKKFPLLIPWNPRSFSTPIYPFLVHWKARGLDKRPDIPFDVLVENYFLGFCLRDWKRFLECSIDPEETRQIWKPKIAAIIEDELNKRATKQILDDARLMHQARQDTRLAIDKRTVMKDVAEEIPSPRGGGLHFTRPECQVLISVYDEIHACIKEVRRTHDIPLKNTPDFEDRRGEWAPEYLLGRCSWLNYLFDLDELPLFVISSAPADCALKILARRLNRLGYRQKNLRAPSISIRTLKNLLNPKNLPRLK